MVLVDGALHCIMLRLGDACVELCIGVSGAMDQGVWVLSDEAMDCLARFLGKGTCYRKSSQQMIALAHSPIFSPL